MTPSIQFGRPASGLTYAERPSAFSLLPRADGRVAFVEIGPDRFLDLPGGGVEAGEEARDAAVREAREEAGLHVQVHDEIAYAGQFAFMDDGFPVNKLCRFFRATEIAPAQTPLEDDHVLSWRDPLQAVRRLRHDAHAWAVVAWLRMTAGRSDA